LKASDDYEDDRYVESS